jgi:hypothetical protein
MWQVLVVLVGLIGMLTWGETGGVAMALEMQVMMLIAEEGDSMTDAEEAVLLMPMALIVEDPGMLDMGEAQALHVALLVPLYIIQLLKTTFKMHLSFLLARRRSECIIHTVCKDLVSHYTC